MNHRTILIEFPWDCCLSRCTFSKQSSQMRFIFRLTRPSATLPFNHLLKLCFYDSIQLHWCRAIQPFSSQSKANRLRLWDWLQTHRQLHPTGNGYSWLQTWGSDRRSHINWQTNDRQTLPSGLSPCFAKAMQSPHSDKKKSNQQAGSLFTGLHRKVPKGGIISYPKNLCHKGTILVPF